MEKKKSITPPSPVTEGQIGKLNQNITAKLLKNKKELPSDIFHQVLGDETLLDEIYASIRKRVEARSNFIIRVVKLDRTRTPEQVLKATGRTRYLIDDVVRDMPKGAGEETEVIFFKIGRTVSDNDLDTEYELRGLVPADPYSLAAVHEDDPAFADEHPNGTHWKDKDSKWCFAAFSRWSDVQRCVDVRRRDGGWNDRWWFAGVRKSTVTSDASAS